MPTTTTIAPLPSLPSSARKAKAPKPCTCGCGGNTRGGRYIPGHDSRQRGWAIRIAGGHDTTGITPGERTAAEAYIKSHTGKDDRLDAAIAARKAADANKAKTA